MHLNPNAKCLSSKFNLKLFEKKKNGGHLNPGNTIINNLLRVLKSATWLDALAKRMSREIKIDSIGCRARNIIDNHII